MSNDILRSVHRDFRPFFKELMLKGWTISKGKKHLKLRSPKGMLVSCSSTPSCPFTLKKIISDVNKIIRLETNNV